MRALSMGDNFDIYFVVFLFIAGHWLINSKDFLFVTVEWYRISIQLQSSYNVFTNDI